MIPSRSRSGSVARTSSTSTVSLGSVPPSIWWIIAPLVAGPRGGCPRPSTRQCTRSAAYPHAGPARDAPRVPWARGMSRVGSSGAGMQPGADPAARPRLVVPEGLVIDESARARLERRLALAPETVTGLGAAGSDLAPGAG